MKSSTTSLGLKTDFMLDTTPLDTHGWRDGTCTSCAADGCDVLEEVAPLQIFFLLGGRHRKKKAVNDSSILAGVVSDANISGARD
jgi:hypothetical protein